MSDESTLAASTLLAPLLIAPLETKNMGITSEAANTSISRQRNSGGFADLLAQEIDTDVESLTLSDSTQSPTTVQSILQKTSEFSGLSAHVTALSPELGGTFEFSNLNLPTKAAGNTLPGNGEHLPGHFDRSFSAGSADQNIFTESEPVDTPSGANIDSLNEIDAREKANRDSDLIDNATQITETTLPALLAQGEVTRTNSESTTRSSFAAAANSASDAAAQQRVQQSTTASVTDIVHSQPTTDHSSGGESGDFQRQQATTDGSLQKHLAPKHSELAEFALEDSSLDEAVTGPAASSSRGGEVLLPTPASGMTISPSALTPSSALSLSADKNAAGGQIAQQLAQFVRTGADQAEINLSPPHLGKISVQIALQNDQATVILTAPNAEVRAVMEASLPKLDALLAEAGLTLAEAGVEDNTHPGDQKPRQLQAYGIEHTELVHEETPTTVREQLTLIDAYA